MRDLLDAGDTPRRGASERTERDWLARSGKGVQRRPRRTCLAQAAALAAACFLMPLSLWGQELVQPPGAEVLSLERAIELAAGANRQITIARMEIDKAEEQIAANKTHRLPVFSLSVLGSQRLSKTSFNFDEGAFGFYDEVGPIPKEDTTITAPLQPMAVIQAQVAQPISQLYQIGLGIQMAEVNRDITRQQLRLQQQVVINSVKAAYYALLQTQNALEALRDEISFYTELERLVGDYVAQQTALKADLLNVQAKLAQTRFDALKLEDTASSQKELLNDLLGRDIRTDFRVDPIPDPAPFEADLEPARARALEQRPEVQEARIRVRQAELDRRLKRAEYIPQVYASIDYTSFVNVKIMPMNMFSLGLLLKWDVYDWGRKKHELVQKVKTIDQANDAQHETETQVMRDVGDTFRKLHQARALLGVCRTAENAAAETLRVTRDRYTQNTALLKDVLQAQATLSDAGRQYRDAVLAVWTARANFEKAIGQD